MEWIKRFFREETGTAELTSEVIMIAFVALMLVVGFAFYYDAFSGFFTNIGTKITNQATAITPGAWTGS